MISAFAGSIWITIISDDERLAAREAELRERDRGEEREHERQRDDDADDDQAVRDVDARSTARWIASRKWTSVGCVGSHCGV